MDAKDRAKLEIFIKQRYFHWTSEMRAEMFALFEESEKAIEAKYFAKFGKQESSDE